MRPLSGLNCSPVAIRGTKAEFLDWIGAGLKHGEIQIPTVDFSGDAGGLPHSLR